MKKKVVVMSKRELQRVLQWCNGIRASLGLRPVKKIYRAKSRGILAHTCPIASTIKGPSRGVQVSVGRERFNAHSNTTHVSIDESPLPYVVKRFVKRYDNGLLRRFEYRAPTKKSSKRR